MKAWKLNSPSAKGFVSFTHFRVVLKTIMLKSFLGMSYRDFILSPQAIGFELFLPGKGQK